MDCLQTKVEQDFNAVSDNEMYCEPWGIVEKNMEIRVQNKELSKYFYLSQKYTVDSWSFFK